MHKVFYSASAIALLGLAACTSTSTQPLPNGDPSVNFAALYNGYIADGTLSVVNNEPVLAQAAPNQSGSATMSGAMANTVEIDNDNDVYIIGNVAITADFDAQTITTPLKEDGLTAHWFEILVGIKAEVYDNIFVGISGSYKLMMSVNDPTNFKSHFSPGFNRVYLSNTGFGFNYTISYLIPFKKK